MSEAVRLEVEAGRRHQPVSEWPEYRIWHRAKSRCTYQKKNGFERYGGRGITMCERWLHSFANFYADMGPRPSPKHSIDRIDNDGNYTPSNCRWATRREQDSNRSITRRLTFSGTTKTVQEWAELTGLNYRTLVGRINRGWPSKRALAERAARSHTRRETLTSAELTLLLTGQPLPAPPAASGKGK